VALVTGMIAVTHLYSHIPTILFIYLLVVLALASARGLYAAILTSLLATLSFAFFLFLPPYRLAAIADDDLLTLWVFLATTVTTSHLASLLRRIAGRARDRERELRLLYEQAQELAALQERQRLARELHDSVSQALYGMSLGAHTACEALESNDLEQAKTSIEYVVDLAEVGLAEMRTLIFELRPDFLETEGLVAALIRQVAVLRTRYKLVVKADLATEPDLSLERKQALYRITQESLHNIVKHAHASTVDLRLAQQESEITLEVHDNGRGFDPTVPFSGHLGLQYMRERAAKMGGTLTIQSSPGQGTYLRIQIPLARKSS
jgi:signal transduction histidine kinase